ncbi:MAG: pilus assembly protein [Chloroflexota bacterium]|nr:pilus assembly protein [Chloroflexota bacterium]
MSAARRQRRNRDAGQALAEFALVVPIFLAMLFGVIDLGRVIWANDVLANAAREGARWASVRGNSDLTPTASKDEIRAQTLEYVVAGGTGTVVTVCYSEVDIANGSIGCSGNTDQAGAGNGRGNLVTVGVTSNVPLLTGTLLGLRPFTLSASSSVLVNN